MRWPGTNGTPGWQRALAPIRMRGLGQRLLGVAESKYNQPREDDNRFLRKPVAVGRIMAAQRARLRPAYTIQLKLLILSLVFLRAGHAAAW